MASKVDGDALPEAARAPQVDWSQWSDGDWWKLRRGEDHDQPPRDALKAARMWAHRNGMLAESRLPGPGQDDEPWLIRFVSRGTGPE